MGKFEDDMADEIDLAKGDAAESRAVAMNSYGAGYDNGYLAGLERALKVYRGETND